MNERDFKIGGVEYRCSKVNALQQFHIARRMAPILNDLFPVLGKLKDVIGKDKNDSEKSLQNIAEFVSPIMLGLSALSDQDSEYVLFGLLAAVEVNQGHNWAYLAKGGQLMFQNLDLPQMLQIAGRAFMFNLSGFFSALPQPLPGAK